MSTLAASAFRKEVLEQASRIVQKRGFLDPSLFSLARAAVPKERVERLLGDDGFPNGVDIVQLFPRGFSIAVVEHIVDNTNRAAHQRLEECFNKFATLEALAKNSDLYRLGRYTPPKERNVVEEAMLAKFNALIPYIQHWPEAVALECRPANAPFALKNLVELVDTTCYYAERMENLVAVIASGNILLQSQTSISPDLNHRLSHTIKRNHVDYSVTEEERFWHSFSADIPLSSGPHVGKGMLSYGWYARRAKVAAVFSLGMLSLMGENASHHVETKAMVRCITEKLF